ncbi:hypothetical protein BV20DRAFT_960603 [Pilatotrama ljubarskyi]|nr:hypothetical protein BV20DRAFT_960603 [Pilatotrama ljubarskyi]
MSAQALAEDQLLELLLTLKRTTPNEARTILNSQPQIAYALMAVMADIGAVKMEVVQETLAKYGALPGAAAPAAPAAPVPPPAIPQQPAPAIPPHMQSQMPPRGGTPTYPPPGPHGPPQGYPPHAPTGYPGHGYGTPPPPAQVPGYGPPHHAQQPPPQHAPPQMQPPPHMQGPPPAAPAPPSGPRLPDAFAALPEDQKAVIIRVMQMSREEVYAMPPSERENIIKLRATLGLST